MRKYIITIMAAFIFHVLAARPAILFTKDTCCELIIPNTQFNISYNQNLGDLLAVPIEYKLGTDAIYVNSQIEIQEIIVTNTVNAEIEYILPVNGKKLRLSMKLFEEGNYQLNFNFKGSNESTLAYVVSEP